MSKSAVDVAMVGVAVGPAAIAGLGFANPFWGIAFTIGIGVSTGSIALVSQSYGAEAFDSLGQAVRSSVLLVTLLIIPVVVVSWTFPTELISLLTDDEATIKLGGAYLQVVALGMPFIALNLVGERVLVGADDAWTPMVIRAGGAVSNIALNGVLIFGLGMGVVGAAVGTVLASALITVAFGVGLVRGRLPGIGAFPVVITVRDTFVDVETVTNLIKISLPVVGRYSVWTGARFPTLAFLALFGSHVVAAYVITERIWGLMNTPGWGFGLATSSLVGQSLGEGNVLLAERYTHEIMKMAVVTYVLGAGFVLLFAEPIVMLFVDDPTGETVSIAVTLVYVACIAIVARGIDGTYSGALDGSGDTKWTFYSRVAGLFGFSIPLVYLGATTPLGMYGLYLSYLGKSLVPALINYHRFSTGKWKNISRQYQPDTTLSDN